MKKLYYSISEVSEILQEEHHILRYWEKEFELIKPRKNRGGNRIYSPDDLEIIRIIHHLIRLNSYSVKQVKDIFANYPTKTKLIADKAAIIALNNGNKSRNKQNHKNGNSNGLSLKPSERDTLNSYFDEILSHLG
jgi:DNA-binding transcriptional MerR regulator